MRKCYSSWCESRTGRWVHISCVFAGMELQETAWLCEGDPDTQVRAHLLWENECVTAFTLKSNVGRSGYFAGEIYRAVIPVKGLCSSRVGLEHVLWGFPFSPAWMRGAGFLLICFFWSRSVVIPEAAQLPLQYKNVFLLPLDFLSGSVYIDPSTPWFLVLENYQPVCIGDSSSPCIFLTVCNLSHLFGVKDVFRLEMHLGFWNCCGSRCLNYFWLGFFWCVLFLKNK